MFAKIWNSLRSLRQPCSARAGASRRPERKSFRWRPQLEALEERVLLRFSFGVNGVNPAASLDITCIDNDNHIVVSDDSPTGTLTLTQTAPNEPGEVRTFPRYDFARITFHGGLGNDCFVNTPRRGMRSIPNVTTRRHLFAYAGAAT